jgi:hypothetical protein
VFHSYIQSQLIANRTLTTPFGRVRQFLSLRDYSDNKKVFKEAYAQLPQSTVGDNTGMAILWLEQNLPGFVLLDGHDSVVGEADDNLESVIKAVDCLEQAFNRIIRFPNGLKITIPIELEIGYDLEHTEKCAASDKAGLTSIYNSLVRQVNRPLTITSGVLQQSSQPL